jgi:hypothetical protein
VFVAEANSIESKPKLQTHQTMREVATENKITFIDMNQYIIDHQNDGIIWWDFVHFTTFGFKLVATHLFETLKSSL